MILFYNLRASLLDFFKTDTNDKMTPSQRRLIDYVCLLGCDSHDTEWCLKLLVLVDMSFIRRANSVTVSRTSG